MGPAAGGTRVTIVGGGFVTGGAVNEVRFGTGVGTNLTVVSDSLIEVDTPAGASVVSLSLNRTWLNQGISIANAFQYLSGAPPAPFISSLSPLAGPTSGGTQLVIYGTNFDSGATVSVGGVQATGVTVQTQGQLLATTPPGSAGTANVTVTNPDAQAATVTGGFTYVGAPSISSVAPATSWTTGGAIVTVSGTGFGPGVAVSLGGSPLTGITLNGTTQIVGTTTGHNPGVVAVTVTNVGNQQATLPAAFTYLSTADQQTTPFVFDTANGIDCRRRWYVNMASPSFRKDLQNRGLQTWGTAGDNSTPPSQPALVDALALDWMRAYVLSSLNVLFGRNTDGSKVTGTSINITFTGLVPASGSRGCANASTDWSEIALGGCDPGTGGPHPIANQICGLGLLGAAQYDSTTTAGCNVLAEQDANSTYHTCTGCTWGASPSAPYGVFAAVVGTQWIANMGGGPLTAADHQYLDGSVVSGFRYGQIHGFMQQYAYRLAYVTAHEIAHSTGLVSTAISGSCAQHATGLCATVSPAHNSCCSTNVMNGTGSLSGTFTQTSRAFSGQPGSVSAASSCYTSGFSSWAMLQAFCGTSQ